MLKSRVSHFLSLALFSLFVPLVVAGGDKAPHEEVRSAEGAEPVKLLMVGDSQTEGSFGAEIYRYLTEGLEVSEIRLLGVGGSSVRHWANSKENASAAWLCSRYGRLGSNRGIKMVHEVCREELSLSPFLEANAGRPNKVVFQFLGNSAGQSREAIEANVALLLEQLNEAQSCLFLTSPPFHQDLDDRNIQRKETEDMLVAAVGERCRVSRGMDLLDFKNRREFYVSDKIHLSAEGARAWLRAIEKELNEFLIAE